MTNKYLSILISLLLFSTSVSVLADPIPVDLEVSLSNVDPFKTDKNRTPVLVPTIILDDHTLYLYSGCDNTTIEIVDEDEMVVYSTSVPEGTETIELPSTLAGTYEIRITRGMFVFSGEIEL